MEQIVVRNALGLYSHPNFATLPPGALTLADNCVISREGIVSKRRGFNRYNSAEFTNIPDAIGEGFDRIIVRDGSTLKYDSDGAGTFASWSGTFNDPVTGIDITFLTANGNLYLTTSTGVFVTDALTTSPVQAGVAAALDVQLAKTGTGDGFWNVDTQISYRVYWEREDANENKKRGAPSSREVLSNPTTSDLSYVQGTPNTEVDVSHTAHGFANGDIIEVSDDSSATIADGQYTVIFVDANNYSFETGATAPASGTITVGKKHNISLTTTIPVNEGIVAGDKLRVFRSGFSANINVEPDDDHIFVQEVIIDASDVSTGTVTVTDALTEAERDNGENDDLYTNPRQDGILQKRDRPPHARFMAHYKGHLFFGNYVDAHQVQLELRDVAGLVDNTSSITLNDQQSGGESPTYTFSTAEDIPNQKFQRFTSGTAAENRRDTMKSLVKVINRDSNQSTYYADYLPGNEGAPGVVIIRKTYPHINEDEFTVTANASGTGDNFLPIIPTSGGDVTSSDNAHPGGLRRSRFQEPEGVPKANENNPGRSREAIQGMIGLKEALIVFKEDGLFVLTGQTDGSVGANFVVEELDPTIQLTAPNTLVSLDNSAIAYTSQDVIKTTPGGSGIWSRNIEISLKKISAFTNFESISKGVSYEDERKYLLFTQIGNGDTKAEGCWVYDYLTHAWTRWLLPVSDGHVLTSDRKLYLLSNEDKYILQERKDRLASGTDFQDETLDATVDATSTTTDSNGNTVSTADVTFTAGTPQKGWLFQQSSTSITSKIRAVTGLGGTSYRLQLSSDLSATITTGACTLTKGIEMVVEYILEDAGNVGLLKQYTKCQVYLEQQGGTHSLTFRSDLVNVPSTIEDQVLTNTVGWGSSPWGSSPWGDIVTIAPALVPTRIPRNHQKCRSLRVRYTNQFAREGVNIIQMTLDVRTISSMTERQLV